MKKYCKFSFKAITSPSIRFTRYLSQTSITIFHLVSPNIHEEHRQVALKSDIFYLNQPPQRNFINPTLINIVPLFELCLHHEIRNTDAVNVFISRF